MAATMARPSMALARPHPATVRHVLCLVRPYLSDRGPTRVAQRSAPRCQIRTASHAAMRIDDADPPPPPPPRSVLPAVTAAPAVPIPYWAALPPPLHGALYDLALPSAHAFRCAFISSSARAVTLAPVPVLALVLDLFRTTAAAEDWAWLADTLAVALRQTAKSAALPGSPALIRAARAAALGRTGEWGEARKAAASALRDTVALTDAGQAAAAGAVGHVDACLRLYHYALRRERRVSDLADVLRFAGVRAQRFVLGARPARETPEHELHALLCGALTDMADPVAWTTQRLTGQKDNDTPVHQVATCVVVALVGSSPSSSNPRLGDALGLFRVIRPVPALAEPLSVLGLSLAHAGRHGDAASVFDALRRAAPVAPPLLASRELKALALAGKHADVVAAWGRLCAAREPGPRDRHIYLRSLALQNPQAVPAAVSDVLGSGRHADSHYDAQTATLLLDAAMKAGDLDAALRHLCTLDRLSPMPPPLTRYTDLLFSFAAQANLDGAIRTFDAILAAGLEPTLACFTTLIALFADRHDVTNSRLVFDAMLSRGLEPDAVAWAALIDAEVEAGEYDVAADRLGALDERLLAHPSVAAAALKAFVHVGAPVERVMPLFRRMERPSAHAWALVIQSAADSGDLALARALFDEMDAAAADAAPGGAAPPGVNVYVCSILLAAHLRAGARAAARGVYDDMLQRGLVPSTVTYALVVRSFTESHDGRPGASGFQRAHDLAMTVLDGVRADAGRPAAPRSRGAARRAPDRDVEDLVGPLLVSAGRAGDVDVAARYFDLAETRSISFMAKMMAVHARAGRVADVSRLFDECLARARALFPRRAPATPPGAVAAGLTRTHNNALCVPLSVLLHALAAAGDRARIRHAWERVRAAGFGFDSQNYNHLAAALAQTGDVEGACHVVDRVILPRYDEVCERYARGVRPGGGLRALASRQDTADAAAAAPAAAASVDAAASHRGQADEADADSAEHGAYAFDQPAAYGAPPAHPPNRRAALLALAPFPRGDGNDFDVLREWRPGDALWRVGARTLAALSEAYGELEDARANMWMALGADEQEADADDDAAAAAGAGAVRLRPGEIEVPDARGQPKRTTPKALLVRINRKYARVVALVMLHRRKQADRRRRR